MQDSDCDVLIIGAGAAGLAAACELADSGRQVLIIEARDRLGGRIWTRQEPGLAVPIEYGAEFIHGHASATMAVLQRAGKTAIESSDSHFRLKNGELVTRNDFFHDVLQAMRDNSALAGKDLSFDAFLAQCKSLSPESRQFARMMAEGFDAVDTSRASARAIVEEWTGDMLDEAAPHSRPQDGYAALLPALANSLQHENLHLQMQSIVREVRWSKGSVEVDGTFIGSPFRASAHCAIITLPLGVLQLRPDAPGAVRFTPVLETKRKALQGLASGPVVKLVLRFASAFWEKLDDGRYLNAAFFHAPGDDFQTFWTQLPARAPFLVAWAGGPKAGRMSSTLALEDIVGDALATLQDMFGKNCSVSQEFQAAYYHDWQQDPFARGAYSYVMVGGDDARSELAAPIENTLFFAGEATDTEGESTTVTGALQSGTRAAREALALASFFPEGLR